MNGKQKAPQDFLTSDIHFLHKLMAVKRGFIDGMPRSNPGLHPDVAAHDEAIISNWNKTVKPWDRVRVLGDVSLAEPELFWPLVDRLNGEIHLITGNHDAAAPQHLRAYRHQREWMGHFASVLPYHRMRMEGQDVLLSHYPYEGDGEGKPARYPQYRLPDEGLTIVHGHTHKPQRVSRSSRGTLQIHVGMDAHNLTPVPVGWVQKIIRNGGTEE